jgi:response regulator RpfG family c-di-GMP phosphodiesterase
MSNDSVKPCDDELVFANEPQPPAPHAAKGWKVLVVDDERDVHVVTKWVLKDFVYHQRGIEFLSAYSGAEARNILAANPDVAVVLLDVVMEEQDSGLKLVRHIREELRNKNMRIILRTGQAGLAPEHKVIVEYDINDYKEKTELTAQKLTSSLIVALRTFCDIETIEANRRGLEQIISASPTLFEYRSMQLLASGILMQITALLNLEESALCCAVSGLAAMEKKGRMVVLAATGEFSPYVDKEVWSVPDQCLAKLLAEPASNGLTVSSSGDGYCYRIRVKDGGEAVIFFRGCGPLAELDRKLVAVFLTNVSAAFDNLLLNKQIEGTLKEIIISLGEVIERRSQETGNHVRRVSEYIHRLALAMGMERQDAEQLKLASMLHDVGKVGVSDLILNKPGPLTLEEFADVKRHTVIGGELFRSSSREVLRTAGIIAHQHHERFDGSGYPRGLKGEEIHLYGRICAIADVFDALSHDRVYKKAWEIEEVVAYIKEQSGKQFDPRVVEAFLAVLHDFLAIREEYKN